MSGKLDLLAESNNLAEDLAITPTPLVSRPAVERPALVVSPAPEQGREEVSPATPTVRDRQKTADKKPVASVAPPPEDGAGALDALSFDREVLVPLNVRIPGWVATALEQEILKKKMANKRIKKESVVAAALIQLLGLTQPPGE